MRHLTDEDIRRTYIVKLPMQGAGQDVYVTGQLGKPDLLANFTSESVDPRFTRLFQAAPVLYQVCYAQWESLGKLEKALEKVGAVSVAADVCNMRTALKMCMGMATEGVDQASQDMEALHILQEMTTNEKAN